MKTLLIAAVAVLIAGGSTAGDLTITSLQRNGTLSCRTYESERKSVFVVNRQAVGARKITRLIDNSSR